MSENTKISSEVDQQVRRLVMAVEQARAQRNSTSMVKLLQEAERLAPNHPLVQVENAKVYLYSGQPDKAIELLARLTQTTPHAIEVWMSLAHAYRVKGLMEDELTALNQALKVDPSHPLILLQKAEVLDLLGRNKAAFKVYANALKTIPNNQKLSSVIEAQVAIAKRRVSEGSRELANYLDNFLANRINQVPEIDRRRFSRGLERFLGQKAIFYPEPTLFLYPFLSNQEFYNRDNFAWLSALEAATDDIRAECIKVLTTPDKGIEPYVAYPDGLPLHQWAELNRSRRWSAAFLWKEGAEILENTVRCPNTVAVLRAINDRVDIPNRGPTAFFSILDAKTTIPPHTGVTNSRLTVHLPLVVPPGGCAFRVGSDTRFWQEGEAWVFDDSIEHEAHNPTELPRAILIFDVWHPELNANERILVRELMVALHEYYIAEGVGVEWAL